MTLPESEIVHTPVESNFIRSIGYSPAAKVLAIAFRDGAVFHYADVEPQTFEIFRDCTSKGKFFHRWIKGIFESRKIKVEDGRSVA